MTTSNSFLLAVAVQRFIKICRPTAKQMTLYWRRTTVVLVIVTNTLYSIPSVFVSGVQKTSVVYRNVSLIGETCTTANHQYPLLQLIYYGILVVILVANIMLTLGLYTPIACVIYRRFQRRTGTSVPNIDRSRGSKTKFNVMFLVIISVYVVSYIPTAVMITYVTLDSEVWATSSYDEIRSYKFLIRTFVFNHAANPFIYAYFDSEIRSHMTCSSISHSTIWSQCRLAFVIDV